MSYNVPVRHLQGGSVLQVASSGTIDVQSGGSIQIESGAVIQIAPGGSFIGNGVSIGTPVFTVITLGGTTAKWAFGTVGITSGVGTIGVPGFTRILSASANPVLGEAPGLGSFTTLMVDLSLSGSGSIIFHAGAGTLPYTNNGTVSWMAFGT